MMRFLILLLVIIPVSFSLPLKHHNFTGCALQRLSTQVRIYITISSVAVSTNPTGIVQRHLEVNWIGAQPHPGDSVGVYDTDPQSDPFALPMSAVDPTDYPGGYYISEAEMPVVFFNLSSLSESPCLGMWAAYKNKSGSILASSCLEIQPFWMEESKMFINHLSLPEIMVPGSHDSGSFYFHKETAPIAKYKYAQDEPIFNQLVYGLRYFDLRVGYYRKTKAHYYINHNFLRTQHSVKSVLHQVAQFLSATREIIILDFHNFPVGFKSDAVHVQLMNIIVDAFRPYMIPYKKRYISATFRTLWSENKRILISYDSNVRKRLHSGLLWPGIPRAWGNKQHPQDLKHYFEDVFQKPTPQGLWASMAELTPNTRTILLHPESGLRVFAEEVNRNVTHWFRDLYWHKANIVATDYFLGNNIINVAVATNRLKGSCPKHEWKRVEDSR